MTSNPEESLLNRGFKKKTQERKGEKASMCLACLT